MTTSLVQNIHHTLALSELKNRASRADADGSSTTRMLWKKIQKLREAAVGSEHVVSSFLFRRHSRGRFYQPSKVDASSMVVSGRIRRSVCVRHNEYPHSSSLLLGNTTVNSRRTLPVTFIPPNYRYFLLLRANCIKIFVLGEQQSTIKRYVLRFSYDSLH